MPVVAVFTNPTRPDTRYKAVQKNPKNPHGGRRCGFLLSIPHKYRTKSDRLLD